MDNLTRSQIDDSRRRLQNLVHGWSEDVLAQIIDGRWTVGSILAHIAFWDRRTAWLIRRCQRGDCSPSPVDLDSINDSALAQWILVPPRNAADEALNAAEDVDVLVFTLSADVIARLQESNVNFDRSRHRNSHLDQIENALAGSRSPDSRTVG